MRIAAVVFDMDGVIVDSEKYWEHEVADILAAAVPDTDVDPDSVVGVNVYDQYEWLDAEYDVAISREAYFERYDRHAETIYADRVALMDGFHDLCEAIRARGRPLALVTSSIPSWVERVLERFDLAGAFDVTVIAGEEDVPGKPEPDLYELAAERLGASPGELLVVEDSEHGVAAAHAAGAHVVAYAHGTSADADHSLADEVASSPADLRERVLAHLDESGD